MRILSVGYIIRCVSVQLYELKELALAINTSEILSEADAFFNNESNNEKLISTLENKIEVSKVTALNLYKDKASGLISEAEYIELSNGIKAERMVYEQRLKELLQETERSNSVKDLREVLNGIMQFEDVDHNTLLMLIDKIYIGRDKEIEIVFNFDDPNIK